MILVSILFHAKKGETDKFPMHLLWTVKAVLIKDKKNIFKRVGDGVFCLGTLKEASTKT